MHSTRISFSSHSFFQFFFMKQNLALSRPIGILILMLSAFTLSLTAVCIKSIDLNVIQIIFFRSIGQSLLCLIGFYQKKLDPFGPKDVRHLLIARGLCGTFGISLYVFSIRNMNLADCTTLFFTSPVLVSVLSVIFLKESFTRYNAVSLVCCLLGAIFVVRPTFIFGGSTMSMISLIPLLGAVFSASKYIFIKKLKDKAHSLHMTFYFGFIGTLVFLVPCVINLQQMSLGILARLLIIIVLGFISQMTLNVGAQICTAQTTSLMRGLDVLFAFVYSAAVFHESIYLTSILGAILIIGGVIVVGYHEVAIYDGFKEIQKMDSRQDVLYEIPYDSDEEEGDLGKVKETEATEKLIKSEIIEIEIK